MAHLSALWPWLTLAALGAFHGLNPAMGWLFAVALGLQERRLRAVTAALGPIALGHTLAIGMAAIAVGMLGLVVPQRLLLALGGTALLGFAAYKVSTRFRHPRWVGMRVGPARAGAVVLSHGTAHGAGLMLVPVLVALRGEGMSSVLADAEHAATWVMDAGRWRCARAGFGGGRAACGGDAGRGGSGRRHRLQKVGVEVLRRAWVNLDFIWVGALVVTGSIALGLSLWPGSAYLTPVACSYRGSDDSMRLFVDTRFHSTRRRTWTGDRLRYS